MSCVSCGSENQTEFASEINVHIVGLENVDKPPVMVFPRLLTCIDCGYTEFKMPESELRHPTRGPASDVQKCSLFHYRPARARGNGEKTPEAWAAAQIFNFLADLELASRPD